MFELLIASLVLLGGSLVAEVSGRRRHPFERLVDTSTQADTPSPSIPLRLGRNGKGTS
jgi:hypothetical protein